MTLPELADWHRQQARDLKLKKVTPDQVITRYGPRDMAFSMQPIFDHQDLISFHEQAEKLLRGVREVQESTL